MKRILLLLLMLLFAQNVLATIGIAPKNPVINGNDWVFMTYNDSTMINATVNITLFDNNNILKYNCVMTLNGRGFTPYPCKYTFAPEDTSGEWKFSVNTSTAENRSINISKIIITLNNIYGATNVNYGASIKLLPNISYEGVLPREIKQETLSRDVGTMQVNSFEDVDGDGANEIVVPTTEGIVYIWQNLSRMYDGLPQVSGQDFSSVDFGAGYAQQRTCHFGDFDGDGVKIAICANSTGQLFAMKSNDSAGANAAGPVFGSANKSTDQGNYRGDLEMCDIDNDGLYEQVAGSVYEAGSTVVYSYTETAGFTWLWNSTDTGANAQDSRPLCDDFDGDGLDEWVIWESAWGPSFADINASSPISNLSALYVNGTDRGTYYQGASKDIDKDGKAEVVFPIATGYLITLQWNGTNLAEFMNYTSEGTNITNYGVGSSNILFDDLDHDGQDDFVIAGTINHPPVVFYEYNMSNASKWDRQIIDNITEQTTSRVEYADFDGDGFKEVIAFGRYSGNTYIYRYNGNPNTVSAWDLIYRGWTVGDEEAWSGDGLLYGATPVNGWHYVGCASGDMDSDGLDELMCTPYDGNFIVYQEVDVTEYNVTPALTAYQTINDGSYENLNSICPLELRLKSSGTNLCLQSTNIALGNTNVTDEDGQNQGTIVPIWTNGIVSTATYRSSQIGKDYATLDASAVAMATYSRIKLGANYTIGKIIMRNYYVDGRSFNNVTLQSTTDNTTSTCNWALGSASVLYNNSVGGTNRKFSESSTGRRIYIEPTLMNCLMESTAGSNYATTVQNTANLRTEIELFEATTPYYRIEMGNESDSTLSPGETWNTTLRLSDRTGFVVNVSTSFSLPVSDNGVCQGNYNAIVIRNDAASSLIIGDPNHEYASP